MSIQIAWNVKQMPQLTGPSLQFAFRTILILPFSKPKAEAKGCKHARRWNLSSYFQPEVIIFWGSASDLFRL